MANKSEAFNNRFVKSLKSVAEDLDTPVSHVTLAQFLTKDKENITEWELRKLGGFNNLKAMNFPPENNIEVKYGSQMLRQHINKVEREHGKALFVQKELLESIKELLKDNPLKAHPPLKEKHKQTKSKRTLIAALSDTHYGANISKEEMHGINEYNWTIAARRTAMYMEQIAHYKTEHRADTDLVLQINGDIIAGVIHNQEWFVDLVATQFAGTLSILTQAVSYLAQHFRKITVVCTSGNHGRSMTKSDKGRATTHKWDSYETLIYCSLRYALTQYKNVAIIIPESPFIVYNVQGHSVFQSHGDTVLNVGNPGKSINTNSINNQVNLINTSTLVKEKVAITSVGHVHVATVQNLNSGGYVVINGCLSGLDPFAQSIGIFYNDPTQILAESTPEHPIGDMRMIGVKLADHEARFDAIITPFTGKF